MRFEIRLVTLFVLLGLVALFVGSPVSKADDAVQVAKAKAKALFSLKATPSPSTSADLQPTRDVTKAIAEAKATSKPLYLWVAKFRKEIAEKLPAGVHAIATEYHGLTDPYLVIKVQDGDYQLEQSKLDPAYLDMIRKIVGPMNLRSGLKRPPIVEVSRSESEEPPLYTPDVAGDSSAADGKPVTTTQAERPKVFGRGDVVPLPVGKRCLCSEACVCGCNAGQPCQCKANHSAIPNSSTIQAGSGIPIRGVAAADWPAPAANHTGPVLFGERMGSVPVMGFFI